jgi:hypothetical protein
MIGPATDIRLGGTRCYNPFNRSYPLTGAGVRSQHRDGATASGSRRSSMRMPGIVARTAAMGWPRSIVLIAVLMSVTASSVAARPAEILGLRVGMEDREARQRLMKLGKPITSIESPKQTWNLRDRRYSSLTIRYDANWRVLWVTAFARRGGQRVRYRDIGDIGQAHRGGSYVYTWTMPVSRDGRPSAITARGPDPTYLSSISIHPPGPASAAH